MGTDVWGTEVDREATADWTRWPSTVTTDMWQEHIYSSATMSDMYGENSCPFCPSCFGVIFSFFRFERPGRSQVVTEHVQPMPNSNTALNDSLGVSRQSSTGSYHTMASTHPHRVSSLHQSSPFVTLPWKHIFTQPIVARKVNTMTTVKTHS